MKSKLRSQADTIGILMGIVVLIVGGAHLFGPQHVATVLVAIGAALAWTFVVLYLRVEWRATHEGRHIMGFTLMVAIILSLAVEVRIFGPYEGLQVVAMLLYGWLVYLLGSRVRLLIRAQRERRRDRDTP
jgi:drug/metabolite transporter (DMT)-like permease